MVGKTATALSALMLGAMVCGAAQAQEIKLYAFSSGALTLGKGYLQNGAPMSSSATRSRCRSAFSW